MAEHDQRFKRLLQTFFVEFLQLFFPRFVSRLDLEHIDWLDKELLADTPSSEPLVLDLVARLRRLPQPDRPEAAELLVLVYVEIESRDSVAPFRQRMYRYYEGLRRKHSCDVLPVAVYLRVGLDGLGVDVYTESYDDFHVLDFHFLYVGLPALDAEQYVHGDNWLGVALSALMGIDRQRRAWLGGEALRRLAAECPESRPKRELLAECVEAYLELDEEQQRLLEQILQTEPYQQVITMNTTTFERGLQQGLQQGQEQGLRQGREQGQRQAIRVLLEDKFGPLSEAVIQRLEAWPAEQLDNLLRATPRASSLRELRLED